MKIRTVHSSCVDTGERIVKDWHFFALIDKHSNIPEILTPFVDLIKIREIIDKRGKRIPIVKVVPHVCTDILVFKLSDEIEVICSDCRQSLPFRITEIVPKDEICHSYLIETEHAKKTENYLHNFNIVEKNEKEHSLKCTVCNYTKTEEHRFENIEPFGIICRDCYFAILNPLPKEPTVIEIRAFGNLTSDCDVMKVSYTGNPEERVEVELIGENDSSLMGEVTQTFSWRKKRIFRNFQEFWKTFFPEVPVPS